MKVDATLNIEEIKAKYAKTKGLAQKSLNSAIITDSNRFIPLDTSTLRNSVRDDDQSVSWNTPYAKKVYYMGEEQIRTQKNPNAKPKWFEFAKALQLEKWRELVNKIFKDNM